MPSAATAVQCRLLHTPPAWSSGLWPDSRPTPATATNPSRLHGSMAASHHQHGGINATLGACTHESCWLTAAQLCLVMNGDAAGRSEPPRPCADALRAAGVEPAMLMLAEPSSGNATLACETVCRMAIPLDAQRQHATYVPTWCGALMALNLSAFGPTGGALSGVDSQRLSAPQHCAWSEFAAALRAGTRVRVASFGGSTAWGRHCREYASHGAKGGPACSFGRRLADLLAALHGTNVEFVDLSSSGSSTSSFLPSLPRAMRALSDGVPTLSLIDFSMNDMMHGSRLEPAMPLVRETAAALEAFVRFWLKEAPRMALLLSEGSFAQLPSRNPVPAAYAAVASHYSLAYVRFLPAIAASGFELAWNRCCGSRESRCKGARVRANSGFQRKHRDACSTEACSDPGVPWQVCSLHPPWTSHEVYAHVLTAAAATLLRGAHPDGEGDPAAAPAAATSATSCADPTRAFEGGLQEPLSELLSAYSVCSRLLSEHEAGMAAKSALPPRLGAGWMLYEDVLGKPGWISTGPLNASLEFDVTLGAVRPEITLKYLQGYDLHGTATLQLRLCDGTLLSGDEGCTLHASRSDGVRATDTAVVKIMRTPREERLGAKGGFGIDAHSRYLSRCVLEGLPAGGNATLVVSLGCDKEGAAQCKFKVLAISSC